MSQNRPKKKEKEWVVYLLYNDIQGKTYLGISNDWKRRLRQHNGEIKGGARNTRGKVGEWVAKCYITSDGYLDRSSAGKIESGIRGKKVYSLDKRMELMRQIVNDNNRLRFMDLNQDDSESEEDD